MLLDIYHSKTLFITYKNNIYVILEYVIKSKYDLKGSLIPDACIHFQNIIFL